MSGHHPQADARETKPDWRAYFDAVAGLPARDTLLQALGRFDDEGRTPPLHAIDLGCGSGRDTFELLRRGWTVLAVDAEPEAIRRLQADVPPEHRARLQTLVAQFEDGWSRSPRVADAADPFQGADLVNASFSIPHCREGTFSTLWDRIVSAIRPGGRFAGQLFGVRDAWAAPPSPDGDETRPAPEPPPAGWRDGRQFHTREQVEGLLAAARLEPEMLNEEERPGKTALGTPKYWHVFHIVARRVIR